MEDIQEKNKVGKRIKYNPFKTADKHYFGGFFNLAENNIKEVFEEINLRLKNKNAPIKNIIEKYTDENISLVEYEKFIAILSEYFPIAKEIDQKNKKTFNDKIIEKTRIERVSDFRNDFFLFIKAIEKLRSYYTHFKHDDIIIDTHLFNLLDNILLNTVLETKKKYLKTDKTKELLKDSLQEELEKLYELKINQLEEKKREVNALIAEQIKNGEQPQRPFRYSSDKDQIRNSIYNDAIKPFLYENANKVEISNKKKTAFNEKDELAKGGDFNLPISSSGIVFLLSCFLNRKEIEDLKANIKGYKGKVIKGDVLDLEKNSIRFMATHRIYSVMCYKGLKNKIRTSQSATKETLLMQMIDELSKIPDVLYKNISEDLQNTFTEDWNQYYKDNFENLDNLENSKVIHPVIRKRYEDKFNYFAIRFLDEFVDFPSLRFQVHLGNYIKHSMSKNVGSVVTTREIKNKIFVFGRLGEINQYKSDFFNEVKEDEEETNWELFPNPNYHFPMENSDELKYANKIGIYLDLWKSKEIINDEIKNQNKQTSSYKKGLVHQITKEKSTIHIGQPIAYLSMNDIHAIIFSILSEKTLTKEGKLDGKNIENKIKKQIDKQTSEISRKDTSIKILKNHNDSNTNNLNLDKLYKDINIEIQFLDELIVNHEEKIIHYNNTKKDKKYKLARKHILYNSEKGELAIWLANDMKRFFPKEFKENWKGHYHSELQKNLAYYETNKKEIKAILNGLDYRKEIPFIDFTKNTLAEFYLEYLKKRKMYHKNLGVAVNKLLNDENINKVKLLDNCFKIYKNKNYLSKNIDEKISAILSNPIFIERGFIDDKPTIIPKMPFKGNEEHFATWFVNFKSLKNNDYQKFYDIKKYPLETKDKSKNEIKKIDSKIYNQKKNDWSTWLMVQYIFKDIFKTDLQNVKLRELFQTREERKKNQLKALDGTRNQNFIWNRTIDLQLNDKVKIPNVKLKDIGNFRKYVNDSRVNVFLSYNDIAEWVPYLPGEWKEEEENKLKPINVIQLQLDDYEKIRRDELLKEVQKLEQLIYDNATNKTVFLQTGNPNFKNYILYGLLQQIKNINILDFKILNEETDFDKIDFNALENCSEIEQSATILIFIRNKFAHNQLPSSDCYQFCSKILTRHTEQTYANYYLKLFMILKDKL